MALGRSTYWFGFLLLLVIGRDSAAQGFVYPVGNPNAQPNRNGLQPNGFVIFRDFNDDTNHSAVDLANGSEGGEVRAIGPGTVVIVEALLGEKQYGNVILIRHNLPEGTYYSLYAHLQMGSVIVSVGETVAAGQRIAAVDCTGRTSGVNLCASNGRTGPHLHFGIRRTQDLGCGTISARCTWDSMDNWVDPIRFIEDRRGLTATRMNDDFNSNQINLSKWFILSPPPGGASVNVVATGQRTEVSMGPGFGGGGLYSRCLLSGNFDIQVDFALPSWPVANNHSLRLGVSDLGVGPGGGFGLNRSSFAIERYSLSVANAAPVTPTSNLSGKMRLVRNSTVLSGFVLQSGVWVGIGSGNVPTGSTHVNLDLGAGGPNAPGGTRGAFDNFRVNSGTVNCP